MFKAGLEIHQQLDTKKLFCSCESYLSDNVQGEFRRTLRPVQSEMGEYDAAAMMESVRKRTFKYQITENSCLVEMDEEPPHEVNKEALEIAIEVSLMFHCKIVDEIHFMRKLVIDGSNTSGFQRTALVGINGYIDTEFGRISIPTVCLEEEAARKIEEREGQAVYRLDRLGIPLIEITTGADMKDPSEVKKIAQIIGYVLRSTGKVKRGLGSIRQDLNVSIDTTRVEVKGVSRLSLIDKIVKYEMERQNMLIELAKEISNRKISTDKFKIEDITDILKNSESKIIRNGISKGGRVLGIALPGFKGLLKSDKFRLGRELADVVRVLGIPGIFHSDELPNYGISAEEVNKIKDFFKLKDNDAFLMLVSDPDKAKEGLKYIIERIKAAKNGVVPETRGPKDDGTTEFLRPLPGKERMYPETDVPPIQIDSNILAKIKNSLPKSYDEKVNEIMNEYNLSKQQAEQIINESMEDKFKKLFSIYDDGNAIFRTLFNTIPELESSGMDVEKITMDILEKIFQALRQNEIVKEAIPFILEDFLRTGNIDFKKFKVLDEHDLEEIIKSIIKSNENLLNKENIEAVLMGKIMKEVKGRAEGSKVNEMLKALIKKEEK
ncbi:MAG: Glu-tRNA(Gln) amidotransferase subunit GatE [Thermoplasmata archaeon]|nr:Glu-tRNA(Gln) amidotransferase subunit GatE [Thermoplasmata archaeon]